jgi:hypothetical protein
MRILLASLITLVLQGAVSAQTYHPLLDSTSNVWHYTANWLPLKTTQPTGGPCDYQSSTQYSRLETVGDTTINGTSYRIIDNFEIWANFVPCRFGYMREDTASRKVYFMPNDLSPEMLMYDFSLNQGDQIQLDFTPFSGVHPAGLYFVDTIFSVNTTAGNRNLFQLRSVSFPWSDPIQWIEGVGSPSGLAYLKTSTSFGGLFLNTGCNDGVYRGDSHLLVCQEQAGLRTYFDSCAHNMAFNNFCFFYGDSCFFYNVCGSLNEIGGITNVHVSPNPFLNVFQLEFESMSDADGVITISDLFGKEVYKSQRMAVSTGRNKVPVQLNDGASGVLLLRLETHSGELLRTLVVRSKH